MAKESKVFKGNDALKQFLAPGALGMTPVVELPGSVNPFIKDRVKIFVKLVQSVPLANIKSLPAWNMLASLDEETLKNTKHLVEYSSGNTVLSLTILARHFGIPNMHAIITPDVPEHKKRLLKLVGTDLIISYGPPSPGVFDTEGGIFDARVLGKKKGWHNFNQYTHPANPSAAEINVGKELWKQLGDDLGLFMASIGTAGTIVGAGRFLKKKKSSIFVSGAAIKTGSAIPGPRGEIAIHKLGIDWKPIVDTVVSVETIEAFAGSLELIRLGLFVGPSTGMQLAALRKVLKDLKKKGKLDSLRNEDGEIVACFIACDSMFAYIDDYFDVLPEKYFKIRVQ